MLERMDAFFEARLKGYDEHMLTAIEGAAEFYPFTAALLPAAANASVLDLGCGTGLELEYFFRLNPTARITGIDLSRGMLDALRQKFPCKQLQLIQASYFDEPLGSSVFDAAVSVESLHHFTQAEKIPLYRKLHDALKGGSFFILTDYFAASDEEEAQYFRNLAVLKQAQGITGDAFYHYDTPLTPAHETQALLSAGFSSVEVLGHWGNTYTLKAVK